MYKLQPKPEKFRLHLEHTEKIQAIATLKDESGGVANIFEDDHCYVLATGTTGIGMRFRPTCYWFPEAIEVLKTLPTPKRP